uniref:Slc38a-3 n=1 Tax=Schmidtea mediterranea TaxID=79327 RepID=A0A0H3YFL1_SCHMD|nr:slc38a-3 [Schmidtea mediterranea]
MAFKLIPSIINLTNYAIGATLMTIPYSFSECGIILSLFLVIFISIITIVASEFLLQAGVTQRRTTYETLCMSCFGSVGKAILELNMVGMMYGSLIAYVIILGDLGSELFHEQMGFSIDTYLRPFVLLILSMVLITPLCLKKNIENLANASALSLLFYTLLTIHLISMQSDSVPVPIVNFSKLNWWKISGLMNVIPIISLGFTIQTQIFPVFNSIPDSNIKDMKFVIRISTALVSLCYISVGIFGYWKFSQFNPKISADLLSMYPGSTTATLMKIGFLASVAISYPLTVFPVRSSLYSLFFVRGGAMPDLSVDSNVIPDKQFNRITFLVIISSFILGFIMNNIEIVLSLTGSFSGSIVLFILPALVYIKSKPISKQRWIANLLLIFGVTILGLSFLNTWSSKDFSIISNIFKRMVLIPYPTEMPQQKINITAGKSVF